jgi:hypothetical protein
MKIEAKSRLAATDIAEHHQQHSMLREECFHMAQNAAQLHSMISELSMDCSLPAWAAEKISLANDYLKCVRDWLDGKVNDTQNPML